MRAGRGLVRRSAAEVAVPRGAATSCASSSELGVRFDADRHGHLALGLEGGHSVRRVVHAGGSATGRRVVRQLSALAAEHEPRSRSSRARRAAAPVRRRRPLRRARAARTAALVRAAPSCSPPAAPPRCGRARPTRRARWHRPAARPPRRAPRSPTSSSCSSTPRRSPACAGREGFLITEAIRGEGATLHDADGERFVDELAPRDEVARAIDELLRATGATSVGLDMRAIDPALFPNVVAALRDAGSTPRASCSRSPPPRTTSWAASSPTSTARSTVPGLYAVGESACTGLHGANRLASNSLSECFVFGRRAALAALDEPAPGPASAARPGAAPIALPGRETREALWRHAGLVRDRRRPAQAAGRPTSARPSHRRVRAAARGEPRLALPARLPRARPRAGPATTRSSARTPSRPSSSGLTAAVNANSTHRGRCGFTSESPLLGITHPGEKPHVPVQPGDLPRARPDIDRRRHGRCAHVARPGTASARSSGWPTTGTTSPGPAARCSPTSAIHFPMPAQAHMTPTRWSTCSTWTATPCSSPTTAPPRTLRS